MVDPKRTIRIGANVSAHCFDYTEGHAVDENFQPRDKPPRGKTEKVSFARLRVNHYYIKSKEQWLAKIDQPRADTGQRRKYKADDYESMAQRFSEVREETITAYVPALKAALAARANKHGDGVTVEKPEWAEDAARRAAVRRFGSSEPPG